MRYRFLAFPGGKQKAVTFSYDDGVKQDIRLAEMFDKYGVKGTFNVNSSNLKRVDDGHLTVDQIKEHILNKGHEVAVHTAHHVASALASPTLCIGETYEARMICLPSSKSAWKVWKVSFWVATLPAIN